MSSHYPDATPQVLDLRPLARSGSSLCGQIGLSEMPRWLEDAPAWPVESADQPQFLAWVIRAAYRSALGGHEQLWLHLTMTGQVPQVCQRCLSGYLERVEVDRWFRFVADESTADAEDDASDEDLLVWTPRFNVREWLEDELLLALPLVPMHQACPQALPFEPDNDPIESDKPNPFAALTAMKSARSDTVPENDA